MTHVLLVEDDERLSQLIVSYLQNQGFKLTRLANGEKLLATVKHTPPDIVVLDVMLPG